MVNCFFSNSMQLIYNIVSGYNRPSSAEKHSNCPSGWNFINLVYVPINAELSQVNLSIIIGLHFCYETLLFYKYNLLYIHV